MYLGPVLVQKILRKKHSDYVKARREKGINMLKCISQLKTDVNTTVALMFAMR